MCVTQAEPVHLYDACTPQRARGQRERDGALGAVVGESFGFDDLPVDRGLVVQGILGRLLLQADPEAQLYALPSRSCGQGQSVIRFSTGRRAGCVIIEHIERGGARREGGDLLPESAPFLK